MATNTRQTNIFAAEDWKKVYTTFSNADFQVMTLKHCAKYWLITSRLIMRKISTILLKAVSM